MKKIKTMSKKLLALFISVLILASMIPMSMFITSATSDYDVFIEVLDGTFDDSDVLPKVTVKFKVENPDPTGFYHAEEYATTDTSATFYLPAASVALKEAVEAGVGFIRVSYNIEAPGYDMCYGVLEVTPENKVFTVDIAMLIEPELSFANPEYIPTSFADVYYGKYAKNQFDLSAVTNEDNTSTIMYSSSDETVATIANADDGSGLKPGTVTALKPGETTIKAWVDTNKVYDFREIKILLVVKEDTINPTDPTVEFSVPTNEKGMVVSNKEITVNLAATDAETGIYKYQYKLDDSSDFVDVDGDSFTMNPMYRGTLLVKAIDNNGNESNQVNADGKVIVLDNNNPTVKSEYVMDDGSKTVTAQDGTVYTNGNITVNFEITEENMDISGDPEVKVDGVVVPSTWDITTGKGSFVITEEGIHNYTITYADIATNSTTVENTKPLAIDRTAPVINDITGNPTDWVNTDIVLSVHATDTGCQGITYSMDDGAWQEDSNYTIKVNGNYSFKVQDALGNTSEATVVAVTKIDKVAPSVDSLVSDQMDGSGNVYWVNPDLTADENDVTVDGKVSDDLSGVAKVYRKIADGEYEEISFADDKFADGSFTDERNSTNTYYCVDAAGNVSEELSIIVKIDKTAPVIADTISKQTNVDITIAGDVIEKDSGLAKVFYRLPDDADWSEATVTGSSFSFKTALAGKVSGFYTYEIYFVDNAGNTSAVDNQSIVVEYDGTAPVVTVDPLDPAGWTNEKRVITGQFTDDWSGVKSAKYVRYSGSVKIAEQTLTFDKDGYFSFEIPNDENNVDTYEITCDDNFTNVSEVSSFVPYIDVVAPSKPTITYKAPAIQKLLQIVTFGIYNAEYTSAVIEATDDLSGVKEIEYTIGDVTKTETATDGKIEISIPAGTKAKITAIAYDNAGNASNDKAETGKDTDGYEFGTVIVDNTAPVVDSAVADPADWTNGDVVISGTVSDGENGSGVKAVYIKKESDGEYVLIAEGTQDADVSEFTYTVTAQDYKGYYVVYCVDYAGNESDKSAVEVKMDITAPVVDTIIANPADWTNGDVVISGTVSDNLSGVNTVYYSIGDGETLTATLSGSEYSIVVKADEIKNYHGNVYVWCDDNAGNVCDKSFTVISIDTENPVVDSVATNPDKWTNKDVVVSGKVVDPEVNGVYSGVVNVQIMKDVEGADWIDVTFNKDTSEYSYTVMAALGAGGTYLVRCIDDAGNVSEEVEVEVLIDVEPPVVESGVAVSDTWTNQDVVISGLVSDDASGVSEVFIKKDVEGAEWANATFNADNNSYTYTVEAQDYEGNYVVYCKDYAGNDSDLFTVAVKMDVTAPTDVKVEYDEPTIWDEIFNIKKETLKVTISANDNLSGIAGFEYSLDGGNTFAAVDAEGKFEIEPQYRGKLIFKAIDVAGNVVTVDDDNRIVVVDSLAPTVDVTYSFDADKVDKNNIHYTTGNAEIKFTITEANFDISEAPAVTVNGDVYSDIEWKEIGTGIYEGVVTLNDQGDYTATINFVDRAGNEMAELVTDEIRIDRTAPVIKVDYNPVDAVANGKYFNSDRTATITVTEHNFDANVIADIIAKDVIGKDVSIDDVDLTDINSWTNTKEDVYVAEVVFDIDAQYTFELDCADIVGNSANYGVDEFVVDKVAPQNLEIDYSDPIDPSLWQKALKVLTFGFYNADTKLEVTVSADDITSGIEYFEYKYTKQEGASNKNADSSKDPIKLVPTRDGAKATAKFTIDPQARGDISFRAVDYATNGLDNWVRDDGRINIVDTIAPGCTVEYTSAQQVVDGVAYYNTNNDVSIIIDEANFYSEDVVVTVIKDNAEYDVDVKWEDKNADIHVGKFTLTEEGDYIVKASYTDRSLNEMADYTSHLIVIDKTAPELTVEYDSESDVTFKDAEGNDRYYFKNGRVATITIDEHNFRASDVVVSVTAKDIAGADIADAEKIVAEYNAYLQDAQNWLYVDVDGNLTDDVTLAADADVRVAQIAFTKEANYTFDIDYADLATNKIADYEVEYFTIDGTLPSNLKVEYSEPKLWEEILENITFGFYNAEMTVTISAEDNIAGVYQLVYSYVNGEGVSKVNAELKDQVLVPELKEGTTNVYEATFVIPKLALDNDNQFNGTVKFAAYDRAGNVSEKSDTNKVVVVDNIKPTATVTFNDAVQTIDGVAYYNGNINATIVINEANFYSDDVEIVVTKNGTVCPISVKWVNNSVDVHTGTFTLTEDGDYVVKVNYTDKSTNEMVPFVSGQLTIDTVAPVINVTDVKHGSANNDEVIGLTVSVTDKNISVENFKPVLNAVIQKDQGNNVYSYETVSITLGEPTTTVNANGETVYTYSINNFKLDGYYTLSCTAVDHAKHTVNAINTSASAGGSVKVNTMNYSVNRNGSVFWIETEHNDKYSSETFKNELNGAYANDKVVVKLYERNVDMVDTNDEKKTVFTLNDGSNTTDVLLVENDNYTKNVIVGTGGWYETVYTLDDDNFDHDGVYSINIVTYDKADNSNVNTKTESGVINFTLDRTNPVISANVKSGQTINAAEFAVEIEVAEANLNVDTLEIVLIDRKGNEKVIDKDDIEELGNNKFAFKVGSGLNYSIRIQTKDLAGNTSELYKVDELTVSTNIFVRWYANAWLFWGSVATVAVLSTLIIILIIVKRKKDEEDK